MHRRRFLQMSAGLALATSGPARAEPITEDWRGDVEILRQAWETMHPGLYRYNTPEQITGRLQGLSAAWSAAGDFRTRFLALTEVTAAVRCGHTYPSPYNADDAVVSRLYPDRALVPFRFRWLDRRMVVTRDDSGQGLFPAGTEITAIDGVPVRDLLARLIPLARADGGNDAKRISLMEVRGDDGYETFDIHLPLVLPLRSTASFTLGDARVVRQVCSLSKSDAPAATPRPIPRRTPIPGRWSWVKTASLA